MTERSLVLIKPDGVQRLLVGRVIARFEDRGLKLVGLKLVAVSRELAERHYAIHRDKPFFAGLVAFITSSPLVAMALEGPNAIGVVRSMVGATRPWEAAEDRGALSPLDAACDRLLKEQLDAVLNSLTGRERRILRLRFGLADGRPRTLTEIGAELGVSRQLIGEIEREALAKLRHPSRSRKLREFLN